MAMQYRSEHVPLSPAELAKQDRRIHRAIVQGMTPYQITKMYGYTEGHIRAVAAKEGLTIADGKRGPKRGGREKAND